MFAQLLWKDWRVNRVPVVGTLILIATPYAMIVGAEAFDFRQPSRASRVAESFGDAAVAGLGLCALMAAVYGGVAFAAERRERSAEFMAMLPVRRSHVLLSKLAVAAACLLAAAAVNVGVLQIEWFARDLGQRGTVGGLHPGKVAAIWNCAAAGVMMFGVAWLLSAFMASPPIAASAAIAVMAAGLYAAAAWAEWHAFYEIADPAARSRQVQAFVRLVAVATGVAALAAGTGVYLRRVRP